MRKRPDFYFIFLAIFLVGTTSSTSVTANIAEDKQALLDFLGNISHSHTLNWFKNSSVCNRWTGVICSSDQTRVTELHLPGVGFRGSFPSNTLSRLSGLQVLSLRLNKISGSFPSDLSKLGNLTSLYLQSNNFYGPLPLDFSLWKNLSVLNLSINGFNGSIPSSITNLTHLTALNLSNNSFSGQISDINIPSLEELDLSNNNLTGIVPRSLRRFPSWAFLGNNISPENATPPSLPAEPPNAHPPMKTRKLSQPAVLAIAIGSCVLVFALVAMMLLLCRSNGGQQKGSVVAKPNKKETSSKKGVSESQDKTNRLFFFEGYRFAFDLEDLLRASAEVLGKGTFGTTYKAALEDTTTLVVKRLKEVTVAKREFEQQMEIVGKIRHENVAPLRAYYYSKDEKLIVFDYYEQGSASAMMHSRRGEGQGRTPVDWETRLRIAVGAARGIAHIHTQNGGKLVHGNLRASNIFLNSQGYGCVCDTGLATLMNPMPPPTARSFGYRAPEVTDTRKSTPASDVYGLGVLILELLTGKSPVHATGTEEVVHLVRWVNSVVREEWTAEVFDVELLRYPNIEEEMVEMLQLGMSCVTRMPERRPKITDVVRNLEEIRQLNSGNRPSSEVKSEVSSTPMPTPDAIVNQ
ncbi:probable inactive receptor kinase At4g23740 [Humulus lupulus]|uniref:probable inactive receptor kinase At4g23740 n=1 Tax=Humulus lupulus TaxID=3486 RepID=UPI002B40241A|nr:probable inactive receptor kinase At4g23740 [Humulus lupulus]XP_062120250.1 probable inactive receptor kinase At4g23740 [Humulus lupulus]XP_062120251.1 probable inactive receptor kinase At4g23740 [Humulus lupulus]XP_062120252.1 probable inactive receptor kinase At4g23740 [Humulus lupulus]